MATENVHESASHFACVDGSSVSLESLLKRLFELPHKRTD
jgi:hypothetical protein